MDLFRGRQLVIQGFYWLMHNWTNNQNGLKVWFSLELLPLKDYWSKMLWNAFVLSTRKKDVLVSLFLLPVPQNRNFSQGSNCCSYPWSEQRNDWIGSKEGKQLSMFTCQKLSSHKCDCIGTHKQQTPLSNIASFIQWVCYLHVLLFNVPSCEW